MLWLFRSINKVNTEDGFLVNKQRDAQILFYVFITLYMFRAHNAHHQERQIVSIQLLLVVEMCAGWKKTRHKIYQESLDDARSAKCKAKDGICNERFIQK
jgi:hypothetical protein